MQNKRHSHYSNFQDFGKDNMKREPTPEQHNSAQLFNWLPDIKNLLQDVTRQLADYRLKQAEERMQMREFISATMKDRKSAEEMMTLILDHLTRPGTAPPPPLPSDYFQPPAVPQVDQDDPMRMVGFVPPTDDPPAAPKKRTVNRLKNTNLEEFLFKMLLPRERYTAEVIWAALQLDFPHLGINRNSIMPTLSRLCNQGKIERIERGVYRVKQE